MNDVTNNLLELVSDYKGEFKGAYNIRVDGTCAGRQSSDNIRIDNKTDLPGLDIRIAPNTKGETVSIPACVTHGSIDDLTYNDFYIGDNADVVIVAGCGVHNDHGEPARHSGIHRFFLGENSHVKYLEKHIGTGKGVGQRSIDPVTEIYLGKNSLLEMETSQIGGVDRSIRKTVGEVGEGARLLIRERILTENEQYAETDFSVVMKGKGSGIDLISRSVAKDNSYQKYHSAVIGEAPCTGHTECDAILSGNGKVDAAPELQAHHEDAALIHEAAIGKIAGEQIIKLQTLGLSEKEAENAIIDGFLS